MHVNDIEAALDLRSLTKIEASFICLVQWIDRQSVQGAEDAHELGRLLDRVTAALEADNREMPEEIVASILARAGAATWLRDDRTYAAGARAVAARAGEWRTVFARGFDTVVHASSALGTPVAL